LRAAGSRRTVTGKSGLPELALLLSVRSPVSPATFLTSRAQKMTRNAKCAFFVAVALGHTRQAAGETLTSKSGLPELATVKLFAQREREIKRAREIQMERESPQRRERDRARENLHRNILRKLLAP